MLPNIRSHEVLGGSDCIFSATLPLSLNFVCTDPDSTARVMPRSESRGRTVLPKEMQEENTFVKISTYAIVEIFNF